MNYNLIQQITNCTHFCNLSKKEDNKNCCSKIVDFQKKEKIDIQLPEPFLEIYIMLLYSLSVQTLLYQKRKFIQLNYGQKNDK